MEFLLELQPTHDLNLFFLKHITDEYSETEEYRRFKIAFERNIWSLYTAAPLKNMQKALTFSEYLKEMQVEATPEQKLQDAYELTVEQLLLVSENAKKVPF